MAAAAPTWEQLRATARNLEADLERSLPQLARLAADAGAGATEARALEGVAAKLDELEGVRDALRAAAAAAPSAARSAIAARYDAVAGRAVVKPSRCAFFCARRRAR